MATVTIYSMGKQRVGEIDLPEAVFGQKARLPLVFEAVQSHLVNRRLGTASTKTRAEVRGGGKKPYKQKGTGNARHGSLRSPIFVGGGTTFGPRPRAFAMPLPRQARRAALRSVLSVKQAESKIVVIDQWALKEPKTKLMAMALQALGVTNGLVVLESPNPVVQKSVRNIPHVDAVTEVKLNPYDLLRHDVVVFTKAALAQLTTRLQARSAGEGGIPGQTGSGGARQTGNASITLPVEGAT